MYLSLLVPVYVHSKLNTNSRVIAALAIHVFNVIQHKPKVSGYYTIITGVIIVLFLLFIVIFISRL